VLRRANAVHQMANSRKRAAPASESWISQDSEPREGNDAFLISADALLHRSNPPNDTVLAKKVRLFLRRYALKKSILEWVFWMPLCVTVALFIRQSVFSKSAGVDDSYKQNDCLKRPKLQHAKHNWYHFVCVSIDPKRIPCTWRYPPCAGTD
jgi:hypothetical protein